MVDLDEYKRLMSERDHHALRTEDERRSTLLGLADAVPDLVAEVERLRAALDRDRTGLAGALCKVLVEVGARRWVVSGRGSYAYDDDTYRKETGFALDAIENIARDALSTSGALAHEALKPKI